MNKIEAAKRITEMMKADGFVPIERGTFNWEAPLVSYIEAIRRHNISRTEILLAIGRAYAQSENSQKQVDPTLADAIAQEIMRQKHEFH